MAKCTETKPVITQEPPVNQDEFKEARGLGGQEGGASFAAPDGGEPEGFDEQGEVDCQEGGAAQAVLNHLEQRLQEQLRWQDSFC